MITATLQIKVIYDDDNYTDKKNAKAALNRAASFLADNGMLTDQEVCLDSWSHTVEILETFTESTGMQEDTVDQMDLPWNEEDAPFKSGDY